MNTQNLERAIKFFEEEPLRLNMNDWVQDLGALSARPHDPPCRTVACLAGSAAILMSKDKDLRPFEIMLEIGSWEEVGMKFFELTQAQANLLFYTGKWPNSFYIEYDHFRQDFWANDNPMLVSYIKKQMVWILRRRVQFFIKTNGTDQLPVATLQ